MKRYDAQQETLVDSDTQYQPKGIDEMLAPYPYQHYQRSVICLFSVYVCYLLSYCYCAR